MADAANVPRGRGLTAEQLERRAETDAIDQKLVARAQGGDRDALGELLQKYGPGLYRSVLLPRLGSETNAKEALAETYAKVVANIARFTWQNVGFYPWLRTVALRVALDQLRAKKRLVLFEEDDLARELDAAQTQTPVDQRISDARDREAARAKVEAALDRIHVRYATAIRLRVLEERPREDVAKELGVTTATFDVLLHRATASLRKALDADAESKETAMTERDDDPDAPASADEIAASQRLRDALEGKSADASDDAIALALALKAAWQPEALAEDEALAVIDAVPTEPELRHAATLREALEDRAVPVEEKGAGVALALALRAAYEPRALGIADHKALVERALAEMPARRRSNVVRVAFGALATGLALAAIIFLVLTQAPIRGREQPLARARTTQPLFDEPFKTGETSARIDRIATSRAGDYRDNRFAKWGVR